MAFWVPTCSSYCYYACRNSRHLYKVSSACSRISASRGMSTTQSHYEKHTADSYESAYFYEVGPYTEHLRDLCKTRLQIDSSAARVLLDIGGGTGSFTRMLIQDAANCRAIVVDPFLEQQTADHESTISSNDDLVQFVAAPAEAFIGNDCAAAALHGADSDVTSWKHGYDQILLKEVAHHFKKEDRIPIFRGLYNGLVARMSIDVEYPSLLIITRPQLDIDYPLWDAAKVVWAHNQPSVHEFVTELAAAGFTDVRHSIEAYPCQVPLSRWQAMIKGRFWSTFANFTDDELDAACREMADATTNAHLHDNGNLVFEDRLLFITASKTV